MLYDWKSRGRLHAAYVISAVWLLVGGMRILVSQSAAWLPIGHAVIDFF